jgi:hypothetical protein
MAGAPTDDLRAAIGDDVKRGRDALDRMYAIVLAPQAKKAYQDGEMAPLTVPTD